MICKSNRKLFSRYIVGPAKTQIPFYRCAGLSTGRNVSLSWIHSLIQCYFFTIIYLHIVKNLTSALIMQQMNLYSFWKGQKAQAVSLAAVIESACPADILAHVKQKLGSWWFLDWLICERNYGPGDLKKKNKKHNAGCLTTLRRPARTHQQLSDFLRRLVFIFSVIWSILHPQITEVCLHHFKNPIVFPRGSVLGLHTCCVLTTEREKAVINLLLWSV